MKRVTDVALKLLVGVLAVTPLLLLLEQPADTPPPAPPAAAPPIVPGQPVLAAPDPGLKWRFQTEEGGAVTRITDPAGTQIRVRRELDGKRLRRLVKELPGGARVVHEFDPHGRRVLLKDPTGAIRYDYDKDNRLARVAREGRAAVSYGYDTRGRLVSLVVGDAWKVEYAYDFLGRLEKIDTPAGAITYTHRSDTGRVERRLPNGVRTAWQYKPGGLLESITHTGPDNRVLARYTYAHRPDGLIREVKESTPRGERTVAYEYDEVQRLVGVTDSRHGKTTYRYDKFGNRTEVAAGGKATASSHDWAGRLTRHRDRECASDRAGNLTAYEGARGKVALAYTPEGRLQSAQAGAAKVGYRYDGDGLLVARTAGGQTTSFVPDVRAGIWRPLLAEDGAGRRTFYLWDGNTPLLEMTDGKARFFLHNHLGSALQQVDQAGAPLGSADYSPFGVPQGPASASGLRPGFAGLFYDAEAGLYLTRARAYDPDLGRFLQRDPLHRTPLGSQKDFSAYAYCGADPVNFVDTDGADPSRWHDQMLAWESLRPIPGEGAYPPFAYYGNWCGGDRMPAEFGFYPRPIDPVDRCCMIHDLQLKLARADNPALGFSSMDSQIASINQGLADCLRQARGSPYTYDAGKAFATYAPSLFDRMAAAQRFGVGVRDWFSAPPAAAPSTPALPGAFPNWPSQIPFPDLYPIWRPPALSPQGSNGGGGARLGFDESVPKGGAGVKSWIEYGGSSRAGPGKVGGIALRGAAKALPPLGQLKGIAVDANGRLVLLAQEGGPVGLPPLRLDDVVTVFRCVYERGESPWVSIDPDPRSPRGPTANVRNGPGTENTYVGWVLYETDRIMKCYNLGADSYTGRPIASKIRGYKEMMELQYRPGGYEELQKYVRKQFGGGARKDEDIRHRFWITPLVVRRLQTGDRRLTLLDVPLQLKTELSVLRDGKLLAVPNGKPPRDAAGYCKWFTEHYQDLAREVYLKPPAGTGMKDPVPVFAELQRIALIAGVAETLREQGVPMPAWMQGHQVQPFPVPAKTPRLTLEIARTINGRKYTFKQYGGVTLTPDIKAVQTVANAPEATKLAPALRTAVADAPSWAPVSFRSGGQQYRAVALPGNDTLAVGAAELHATDLSVPVHGDTAIDLTRAVHSFYDPSGEFGKGWTMDLPRLRARRLVTERTEKTTYSRTVYQLTSPLMTHADTFTQWKAVPEVNGQLLVPQSSRHVLGLTFTAGKKPQLLFRDGREWEFDDSGRLAAVTRGPYRLVHGHDDSGRLVRLEGWYAGKKRATLDLEHDAQGRLTAARGSDGSKVTYVYDSGGRLARVTGPQGVTAYAYREGLLSRVTHGGKTVREFFYDGEGRLVRERRADGAEWTYEDRAGKQGVASVARRKGAPGRAEKTEYDASLRPVKGTLPDGTSLRWHYREGGAAELTVTTPDGERWTETTTAGGAREVKRPLPGGGEVRVEADGAGRVTGVWQNGRKVLTRTWSRDGQPASVSTDGAELLFEYDAKRVANRLLLGGRKKDGRYWNWIEVKCDPEGRPLELTDHCGQKLEVRYDGSGRPSGWSGKRGSVTLKRTALGQPEVVTASWGERLAQAYDKDGSLRRLEVTQEGGTSSVELADGRPTVLRNFDGGVQRVRYYTEGPHKGRVREVRTPNGVVRAYRYDAANRLTEVDCGGRYRVAYSYDAAGRLTGFSEIPVQ
jgi:RHS repeat-associated protein